MLLGCAGRGVMLKFLVLTGLEPQALLATTVIVPPDVPAVVVIELVVEEPVQPLGKVQV